MHKKWLITGALLAGLAVIAGAFGAHGLEDAFRDPALAAHYADIFDTGARYQMYHAFAILVCGILVKLFGESRALNISAILFVAGIVLFSGSLYLLATRSLIGIENWTWLGPVTPLGGLCFIAGWITMVIAVIKKPTT